MNPQERARPGSAQDNPQDRQLTPVERRITLGRHANHSVPVPPEAAKLGVLARWRMRNELESHAQRTVKIDNAAAEAAQAVERTAAVYAYGNHIQLEAIDAMGRTALAFGPESLASEVGDQIVERNINRLDQTIDRLTEKFSNVITRTIDHS